MKKNLRRILAAAFGAALLFGSVSRIPAHADVAEPCDVHTYSYDCDTTCNICGYERSASHTYNLYGQNYYYHWLKCECGAKLDIIAHDFDSDSDLTCSECGYERHLEHKYDTPGADSTYHWDECSCGEKKNKEEHLLVKRTDGTWHWDECTECSTKVNIGAHVWGAGVTEGDVTTYTCTICGNQRTVDAQGGSSGDNTGDGTGENQGDNTGEGGQGGTSGDNTGDGTGTGDGIGNGEGTGNTPGGNTGEDGSGDNNGNGEGSGNTSGDNTGDDNSSGDDSNGDDSKDTKGGNFGKWLFGIIGGVVVLWGGAIAGYLIYQKKKGADNSVKESKESV